MSVSDHNCILSDYNCQIVERFYRNLNVSAVLDCETGNAPYLFLQADLVTGFSADLLHQVMSRIPDIETVNIVAKSSLEQALDDVPIGTSVLDITLTPITRELLLARPTVGYLTVALAAPTLTAGGSNQQYLVYLPFKLLTCYFESIIVNVGANNLPEGLNNVFCFKGVNPISQILVNITNSAGLAVFDSLTITPTLVYSPISTIADIQSLLDINPSVPNSGNHFNAVLLPGLNANQIAQLEATGLLVTPFLQSGVFAPPPTSLSFGWAYLKSSFYFGLWLQRAFDEFVATGGYLDLLKSWELTTQTLPPGSLLQALAVPPRYYSLTTGTVPQVSVIEAFLPKLACVEPTSDVEFTLCPTVEPTASM